MSDRGMKKFLPFSSLVEQESYLKKMIYEKNKSPKPKVSTEQAAKIDRILRNYLKSEIYNITFYYDGYIYKVSSQILNLDLNKRLIHLENATIPINSLVDIENNNPFDEIC